jgi:hypothetical protein
VAAVPSGLSLNPLRIKKKVNLKPIFDVLLGGGDFWVVYLMSLSGAGDPFLN